MKRNKIFNAITGLLVIILIITCGYAYVGYKTKQTKKFINANKMPEVQQMKLISKEEVIQKLSSENSLTGLSGEDHIKATFGNKNISDDDVKFAWLKKFLNGRELNADAVFKFTFAYSLENINQDVDVQGNAITINLSGNRLYLVQCELQEEKTTFTDSIGVLQNKFEPQELNALNKRLKDQAKNTIQSDKDRRTAAIEKTKDNIKNLLKLDKNITVTFNVPEYDVVPQDDVQIIK